MILRDHARFESQLVEGLTLLANALRAGLTFPQAIDVAATHGPAPFSTVMREIVERMQVGKTLGESLRHSTQGIAVEEYHMAVAAVDALLEAGGNIAEGFQWIVETIRERMRVTEKIRTMTAAVRFQSLTISLMPVGLVFLLGVMSPDYLQPLLTWPWGILLCGLCAGMMTGGLFWMRQISRIEV